MKWGLDEDAERMLRSSCDAIQQEAISTFALQNPVSNPSSRFVSFLVKLTKVMKEGTSVLTTSDNQNSKLTVHSNISSTADLSPAMSWKTHVEPAPEDPWERYLDPATRRTWLWCPSTGECFFSDAASSIGWEAFWYHNVGIWWWHASSGRCFVESRNCRVDAAQSPLFWQRILLNGNGSVHLHVSDRMIE
eukprot:gnl/MRDRNA2_/MRDRNA2_16797_c0_seq1.p1 gnl/MRDRNA2_/MRDRNA2_16797_c0~~gnl/MRDRNA2_/MRDRNA2_16797_c0_seq1.p1  ORF type:complete len:191 (+),score=20.67 gnl/MRDRNA2_/MRDRNA2_16797_c0_seq1:82-654(+)